MSGEIKIGKYTLESLTTGMYNDPKIIYREYIQNSVDSLEKALIQKLIKEEEMRIEIFIDREQNVVTINDNGTGIRFENAYNTLTDIGNSKKKHVDNRGFRGIGRLGGLSYCKIIKFITSYAGENKKTTVIFDCEKLKQLLVPGEHDDYDLSKVVSIVTSFMYEYEEKNEHYFTVVMEGIDEFSDLLDLERIKSYIKQVAPLKYDKSFYWQSKIKDEFKALNVEINEFPIFIGEDKNNLKPIYKPNKCRFVSDKIKKTNDELEDVNIFDIIGEDNNLLAAGWYGKCNLFGSIVDSEISGLRVRKGNILIGDSRLLDEIFKEGRFNGWIQGEIFAVNEKLIPNARRDDFEKNGTYYKFINLLKNKIGDELSQKIREASKSRNNSTTKKFKEVEKLINASIRINTDGFNSDVEKEEVKNNIIKTIEEVSNLKVGTDDDNKTKNEMKQQLNDILEKTNENKNYKIKKANGLSRKEINVLKIVTNVLSQNLTKDFVDMLIDEIIKELNK